MERNGSCVLSGVSTEAIKIAVPPENPNDKTFVYINTFPFRSDGMGKPYFVSKGHFLFLRQITMQPTLTPQKNKAMPHYMTD